VGFRLTQSASNLKGREITYEAFCKETFERRKQVIIFKNDGFCVPGCPGQETLQFTGKMIHEN